MRKRVVDISKQVLFALNVLILFLLVFEHYLEIPAWLHVFGRMHPMFLHFPIVILLLAIALDLLLPGDGEKKHFRKDLLDSLFLLGALTASLTVIMGLFLSLEEEYLSGALQLHKWMGVGIAAFGYLIVFLRQLNRERPAWIRASYVAAGVSVVVAGHMGSVLTHGQDFLWEPVRGAGEVMVAKDQALIFDHVVKPVLEKKCMSCHNEAKAKGDFIMLDSARLEAGGKNGAPFVRGEPSESLVIQRAHLPLEDKKHMPPKGKPQLTSEELELLTLWIGAGAPYTQKVIAMPEGDSLRLIAERRLEPAIDPQEPVFKFTAARDEDIRSLQTDYRVIAPVAAKSPALAVNFFNRHVFTSASLADLRKIGKQVVALDLNRMPVKDEDLKTIASFENLKKLNLNFTDITGGGLKHLAPLASLEELSLSGTKISASDVANLAPLKSLTSLYLWQTDIGENDMKAIREQLPGVAIEMGFSDDGTLLKLNLPRFASQSVVFKDTLELVLDHPVRDTHIRYTTDGTDPDSLHGNIYEGPVKLTGTVTQVKTRAYKDGWIGSDIVSRYFLRHALTPDSVVLASPPAPEYRAAQPGLLVDGATNNTEFRSGNWLGYRFNDAEVLFYFNSPVTTSSVTLSTLNSTPSYIFPAAEVEVWGALRDGPMELLGRWRPAQPDGPGNPLFIEVDEYRYKPKEITLLRIIARPVAELPSWHPAKGERGWVFLDEVLVN